MDVSIQKFPATASDPVGAEAETKVLPRFAVRAAKFAPRSWDLACADGDFEGYACRRVSKVIRHHEACYGLLAMFSTVRIVTSSVACKAVVNVTVCNRVISVVIDPPGVWNKPFLKTMILSSDVWGNAKTAWFAVATVEVRLKLDTEGARILTMWTIWPAFGTPVDSVTVLSAASLTYALGT